MEHVNISMEQISGTLPRITPGAETPTAETPTAPAHDLSRETAQAIRGIITGDAAAKAVERAGRMTAPTWHTDMIVSRIANPRYDVRRLVGDFADVELTITRVEQCGTYTVWAFEHFAAVDTGEVKKRRYLYLMGLEKYDTGEKHPNGDPVKGVRYLMEQVSKVDLTALRLASHRGHMIRELDRIARKQAKFNRGDAKAKPLTGVERATLDHFARIGVTVSDLLAERDAAAREFAPTPTGSENTLTA